MIYTNLHHTKVVAACMFALIAVCTMMSAQQPATPPPSTQKPDDAPFVVEYYYKTKWGHADEFITLFKKNHLPILRKQIETGRLLNVTAVAPRYHATEDGRWDYRVTIVFRNAAVANAAFDEAALARQLYPDQQTFKREEQRRFEILDAHWDVPIKSVDLP